MVVVLFNFKQFGRYTTAFSQALAGPGPLPDKRKATKTETREVRQQQTFSSETFSMFSI